MNKNSIVKKNITSIILRIILWFLVLMLIALMFYVYHEGIWRDIIRFYRFFYEPKRLKAFIASFGPLSSVVFIFVQAFQVVLAPIPGEITGFIGGLLFGNTIGLIYSTIGLTLGSLGAFTITRTFGIKFVEKVVKKEYIDRFNDFVTHKGLNITFVLFLLPGFPKDSLCYLLGLTRIKVVDFLFFNIFGRLPGTLMLTLQGNAVRNEKYKQFIWLLIISLIAIIVLYLTRNHIIGVFSRLLALFLGKKQDNKGKNDSVDGKNI
ncbi:MAG: VTT domain-containing protein [Syntrophorhabdaceae bacterium]|nr:VTT domain-containing protein [Syntrophorhabdaceae bacterium]